MLPPQSVILSTFAAQQPLHQRKAQPTRSEVAVPANREIFPAWSVTEDAKEKARGFTDELSREFNVASQKVQEKTGRIEPWTAKYYASCTFGGMLACVSLQ